MVKQMPAHPNPVLIAADGTEFTLAEDCNIFPYLTRNIVTLDDLHRERNVWVWSDKDETQLPRLCYLQNNQYPARECTGMEKG